MKIEKLISENGEQRGNGDDRQAAERIAIRFVTVVRATVKGSGLVALAQGALGAATFWIAGLPAAL